MDLKKNLKALQYQKKENSLKKFSNANINDRRRVEPRGIKYFKKIYDA